MIRKHSSGLRILLRMIHAGLLVSAFLSVSVHAQLVATYTEDSVPEGLLIRPGTTRITGGLPFEGEEDMFIFENTLYPGMTSAVLKTRVSYNHQNGNLIQGIPEHAHLVAGVDAGLFHSSLGFAASGATVDLGSPFFVINGPNMISASPVFVDSHARLKIAVPPGKINPSYVAEIEFVPPPDMHEGTSGNDTAGTATVIDPSVPRSRSGHFHSTTDEDWFRFDVPAGKTLRVRVKLVTFSDPGAVSLASSFLNESSVPLQASTLPDASYVESGGAGGSSYYLRLRSTGGFALAWGFTCILDDVFEPNDSPGESSYIGSLSASPRIEHRDLSVTDEQEDHYFIEAGPTFSGPVYLIALPETGEDFCTVSTPASAPDFVRGNYARISFTPNQGVNFRVTGRGSYRLIVKPETPYDIWQDSLHPNSSGRYLAARSDGDLDGTPAALEWALRRSPFAPEESSVSEPYVSGGQTRVNLIMPQGGTAAPIRIRESTDLLNWTPVETSRTNIAAAVIPPGRTSGVVLTLSRPGEERNFIRFEVDD